MIKYSLLGFPNLSFVPGIISADCNHPFTCGVLIEDLLPLLTNPDLSRSLDLDLLVDDPLLSGHIHLIIKVEDHMIDLHQGIDINILNRSEVGQRTEFKDRLDLLKGSQTKNMHGHLGQEVDQWIEWIGLEIDLGQTMVEEDDHIQEINIEGQETCPLTYFGAI
jgi:hypothetical protein